MASLQSKVESVKASVSSTSTCTPTTVVVLKELLLPETAGPLSKTKSTSQAAKKNTTTRKPAGSSRGPASKSANDGRDEPLSSRERTALATHVVNVTLKSLTEAAKPPPPSTPSKRSDDSRQPAGQRSLRRSLSTPLSPLQTRTLNRVATSPNLHAKAKQAASVAHSTGCQATVECARVAFAALRSLKGPQQAGEQSDFQLEAGMSALIGKLLNLSMHDQALKELRLLKKRLDPTAPSEEPQTTKPNSKQCDGPSTGFGDLLDFHGTVLAPSLPPVTMYQLQTLKLVSAMKRPSHITSILPFLNQEYHASPINLLSRLAKDNQKETAKVARQLASLSQLLFNLAPSISSKDDTIATEPRLSPSPIVAFEIQNLAFAAQLTWWNVAGHNGSVDDEVLTPFLRCARALVRRERSEKGLLYDKMATSFDMIMHMVRSQKHQPILSSNSPSASLYQLLGSAAQDGRQYDNAYRWFQQLRDILQPGEDPFIRVFSISARLLSVALKRKSVDTLVEKLIAEVIESLEGSLSGTIADLNELLDSLSQARRSIVGVMMSCSESAAGTTKSNQILGQLKTFVLRYPRFLRRWLGAPPSKDASAKQLLQFDQRRQLVLPTMSQVLDATLVVIKGDIQQDNIEWQLMDDVLQDCFTLMSQVADVTMPTSKLEQFNDYRVKMSSLCYAKFSHLRRLPDRTKTMNKQMLQALSRSIELIKDCSLKDKEKAQISTKLEVFAELCKSAGRSEEAVQTLRSICRNMAEEGALTNVAAMLISKPPAQAWTQDAAASTLSRTLRSIAKLDKSWNDWTFFLPEAERAAVLEHLMDINSSQAAQSETNQLRDPCSVTLLRLYTLERYPVRRLRVLLHLYSQNIGNNEELEAISPEIEEAIDQAQKKDKGEDTALARFLPHLIAYHSSLSGLAKASEEDATSLIKNAISSWASMLESSQAKDDIFSVIDNPDGLLEHLQSASVFADLRGENQLQISILELSISVSEVQSRATGEGLIASHCLLATTYTSIGQPSKALRTLHTTDELLLQYKDVTKGAIADYYLSQAEYYASIGQTVKAMDWLSKASEICASSPSSWARSKHQVTVVLSLMALLQSTVALQGGDLEGSLSSIKFSVRQLSHDWSKLESACFSSSISENSVSEDSISSLGSKARVSQIGGPDHWALANPLIRSLLQISAVYAHIGMFQETIYYAESAWKIAEACQSSFYMAQVSAWTGSLYLRAGHVHKALQDFGDAEKRMPVEACSFRVRLARQLGEFYQSQDDSAKADNYFKIAEETTRLLSAQLQLSKPTEAAKQSGKTTRARRVAPPKVGPATRATRTKAAPTRKAQSKNPAANATPEPPLPIDAHQAPLIAEIILSRTLGYIQKKDWQSALKILQQAKELPKLSESLSQEQILTAMSLIGHSMDQMIHDPVFSVMQDSTISFPAISGCAEKHVSDKALITASPTAKSRVASKERSILTFKDSLKQAQELLLEAHTSALSSLDSSLVHRVSVLLQGTVILLSATASTKSNSAANSSLATVAVDLARNVSWRREQMTIQAQPAAPGSQMQHSAAAKKSTRRCSFGVTTEIAKFQKKYVEHLPKEWNVISISLSENHHELCITKYYAGQSPFILRLPLGRAGCRDADSETLDFELGREELLDIIKLANESSHSARDFTAKGERSAWWSERERLDERLGELLTNIENAWLCGFKGIFSQHRRRSTLLARFQKNLQQILDNNLPSRRKVRGKRATKTPPITLDPRILDLFIGLGDPSEPDGDFDEALNDLLYFVVDVLQFHGERNAYDEIDFDAMVVETYDALRAYSEAANSDGDENDDKAQTVLVLDKLLHVFPWESMPCMKGLAVSRVPSLACLRQLLGEAQGGTDLLDGHYVSMNSGTYILNPSSDLKNTQNYFKPAFRSLQSWKGIIDRAPEETEFEEALSKSEVLLYFGHGSGAQYIRGKTVRRLGKCLPATFLMGCSSAALTEVGDFESYGPVWNYMMAGCPAVVGTLWDVTDRDIDRFAGRAFEEWGLFPRGTFKEEKKTKGKGRAQDEDDEDVNYDDDTDDLGNSLSKAVAKARNACRFKYLNAAAVVVYGIPTYVKKND
ncbi:Separin [Paramyrothecium foliicola]|nr:Separin [Paramyrothecium foliicola]